MKLPTALGFVVLLAAQHALALAAAPIEIVAAENFYGDVAEQIGGADVRVTSILSDPAVDPHLFEASPSVARVISGARVVVYNGIDYDPWMATLLAASPVINRRTIVVASLAARKIGDNPHIWYDTQIMLAYAGRCDRLPSAPRTIPDGDPADPVQDRHAAGPPCRYAYHCH
jgi:zinc/manganese transport system substrate-binding protein